MEIAATYIPIAKQKRRTLLRAIWLKTRSIHPPREAVLTGVALALLQALDGLLTSIGVNRFGLQMEGNPLLRELMAVYGHNQTLFVLKLLAVAIIVGLTLFTRRVPWVKDAMTALCCVYLVAAVLPWTYILFLRSGPAL